MARTHQRPETPTTAERDESAARPALRGTRPVGTFAVWACIDQTATVIARFPFSARPAADAYASKIGGFVQMLKESAPADPFRNPPPVAPRVRIAPASVRVWEDGTERVLPFDNRQDAISHANKMAETLIDHKGGTLSHSHGVRILRRREGVRHVYTIIDVLER